MKCAQSLNVSPTNLKRTARPRGFRIPDVPGKRYVDPRSTAWKPRKHMWHKTWVYAGSRDEVPEIGLLLLQGPAE